MDHALLSPSGASRWTVCTPSARLETKFPDSAGIAAEEGTLAHKLSELLIAYQLHDIRYPYHNTDMVAIEVNPLYNVSMLSFCTDYANYVLERFNAAKAVYPYAKLYLETRLDLSAFITGGFGTGDVAIVGGEILEVIDLKYGQGVHVSVKENKQTMTYALGWWKRVHFLYDIKKIRLTIYQPRLDNISQWEISVNDLLAWANLVLIPKAKEAYEGTGKFVAGEHCRFCRAKVGCKANYEFNIEIAKQAFADPVLLNDKDISSILAKAPGFINWVNAIQDFALLQATKHNKKWPGFKLVTGRSSRKFTDPAKVAEILESQPDKFKESDIYNPRELKGITDFEKLLSKPRFKKLLNFLTIKPDGKPTLVPETDERKSVNSIDKAKELFADY